jgi:hypothetical protein
MTSHFATLDPDVLIAAASPQRGVSTRITKGELAMRKTQISKKQKATIVGGTVAALVMGGAAFAYWTAGGSGSATAKADAAVSDLSLATSTISGLVPGATVTVPVTATNPNATTSVAIKTLTAGAVTSDKTACTALIAAPGTAVTAVATATSPAAVVAPNGGTAVVGSVDVTMANSATVDQSSCKGATFTVALTAAG